ncbi:MAG: DUF4397 domain-containing protein [Phototrophicaceae bacterium]
MKLRYIVMVILLLVSSALAFAQDETTENEEVTTYQLMQPNIDEASSVAYVQFAHTSVDVGAIDIYYATETDPVVINLQFGETTDLIRINSGNQSFTARGVDNDEIVTEMNWDFGGNTTWLVSAVGLQEKLAFLLEPVSVLRGDYNDLARIRVVNFIPDGVRSTVIGDAEESVTLANNVGWIGIGDTMVEAGEYTLSIALDNDGVVTEPVTLDVSANTTYTVLVVGRGTDEMPAELLIFENVENIATVQFIHEGSSTLDIWYRPADEALLEGFEAGSTSQEIELSSRAVTFISYLSGEAPTGQEQGSEALQLLPYHSYVITITDDNMQLSEELLLPLVTDEDMADDNNTQDDETED